MWYVRELLSVSYMGIIGTIGVILNLLLLRAVYRSTPPSMKVYSILIVNTAMVDLIGSLSTILTIPREQSSSFGIIVIFYGLGSTIDTRLCWICFALMVYSLVTSHYLLCSSFVFRSYAISGKLINLKKLSSVLIPVNIINLLFFLGVLNELLQSDRSRLREISIERIDFDISTAVIGAEVISYQLTINSPGIFDIKQRTSTLITLLFTLGTAPLVFISCFLLRNRIIRELEKRKFLLSQTTHQLHRMLLDALRFQLLATSLLFITSAIFVISHFDIFYSSWMDFLQPAIVSSIIVASPFANLYYILPYRRSIVTLFRKQGLVVDGTVTDYSTLQSL